MKRISLIILAVAAILYGGSCSKVDDTTQSPLSLMSMSIIPDYSNGSIKCYPEPFGMSEDGLLSFKVEILPLQYLGQFGIDDKYIYKASFRKVITKSESDSYDFTLDGTVQKYEGDDFLTASFVLKPDVMGKIKANDYMVSFIIGDAAAAQSVSTAFVPLSSNRSSGKDFPDNNDELLPSEVIIDIRFNNPYGIWPLGTYVSTNSQVPVGEEYPYFYNYEYNGSQLTKEFTVVIGGKTTSGYSYSCTSGLPYENVAVLRLPDANQWIMLPGIDGKYLSSVTFGAGNAYNSRKWFKIQTKENLLKSSIAQIRGYALVEGPIPAKITFYSNGNDCPTAILQGNTTSKGTAYYIVMTDRNTMVDYITATYSDELKEKP